MLPTLMVSYNVLHEFTWSIARRRTVRGRGRSQRQQQTRAAEPGPPDARTGSPCAGPGPASQAPRRWARLVVEALRRLARSLSAERQSRDRFVAAGRRLGRARMPCRIPGISNTARLCTGAWRPGRRRDRAPARPPRSGTLAIARAAPGPRPARAPTARCSAPAAGSSGCAPRSPAAASAPPRSGCPGPGLPMKKSASCM